MGRKKKAEDVVVLPEGFPTVGSYTRYYFEGWRYGKLVAVKGRTAVLERPGKRDLSIPITDVEIPEKKGDT
jgi:hypothetical protein